MNVFYGNNRPCHFNNWSSAIIPYKSLSNACIKCDIIATRTNLNREADGKIINLFALAYKFNIIQINEFQIEW